MKNSNKVFETMVLTLCHILLGISIYAMITEGYNPGLLTLIIMFGVACIITWYGWGIDLIKRLKPKEPADTYYSLEILEPVRISSDNIYYYKARIDGVTTIIFQNHQPSLFDEITSTLDQIQYIEGAIYYPRHLTIKVYGKKREMKLQKYYHETKKG